ncbi:MAG: hypothetical protein UV78_C0028G0001, partial [Parcubacteria group bacterium GW2011_GWA2_43_17]
MMNNWTITADQTSSLVSKTSL